MEATNMVQRLVLNRENLAKTFIQANASGLSDAVLSVDDDKGSCNFDAPAIRVLTRLTPKLKTMIEETAALGGCSGWWGSGWMWKKTFIFTTGNMRGQGWMRTKGAEAAAQVFKDANFDEFSITVYYQMD